MFGVLTELPESTCFRHKRKVVDVNRLAYARKQLTASCSSRACRQRAHCVHARRVRCAEAKGLAYTSQHPIFVIPSCARKNDIFENCATMIHIFQHCSFWDRCGQRKPFCILYQSQILISIMFRIVIVTICQGHGTKHPHNARKDAPTPTYLVVEQVAISIPCWVVWYASRLVSYAFLQRHLLFWHCCMRIAFEDPVCWVNQPSPQ